MSAKREHSEYATAKTSASFARSADEDVRVPSIERRVSDAD
jgi:hypothetical protein